ncbi:hypothetical protein JAAARDRAFT_141774 [Jaapia argillacea MUCL 33604]|uniref:Uncharacterized protein n=1 Tax=Jaapia argillacea MUCL 33604 TaxID=933084 RepID=A0A067P6P4_9AGAM|nr:hypothetical protein JAAARDRAFT_141774 [Jaapia argillacea MUCL 33604]
MRAELPTVSILCTLLLLPTLHWQWRTRDVAILSTITWLLACNLIHVINSIVWADNVVPRVPVWCDLTTKILLGAPVAIAGACLCICQRLEFIASMRELACNGNRKRRRTIMEFALCIVIPFVYMAFHTLVQNHRFDIIEDFGCEAAIYASAPAVILVWLPPILICITSLVYSILVLIHAYSLHSGFSRHIANRSRFTQSTFTRLLSMSMLQTFLLTWFFLTTLVLSAFRPWTSFKQVHSQMSTIAVAAESDLSVQEHIRVELVFWIIPVLSVIVFVFGVMGERAQQSIKSVVKDIRIRSRSLSLPIQ